jgi:hypothetical protein
MRQKRCIRVVEHLEHARVKNYAGSVYVLKPDRPFFDEGTWSRKLELVTIEAMHGVHASIAAS